MKKILLGLLLATYTISPAFAEYVMDAKYLEDTPVKVNIITNIIGVTPAIFPFMAVNYLFLNGYFDMHNNYIEEFAQSENELKAKDTKGIKYVVPENRAKEAAVTQEKKAKSKVAKASGYILGITKANLYPEVSHRNVTYKEIPNSIFYESHLTSDKTFQLKLYDMEGNSICYFVYNFDDKKVLQKFFVNNELNAYAVEPNTTITVPLYDKNKKVVGNINILVLNKTLVIQDQYDLDNNKIASYGWSLNFKHEASLNQYDADNNRIAYYNQKSEKIELYSAYDRKIKEFSLSREVINYDKSRWAYMAPDEEFPIISYKIDNYNTRVYKTFDPQGNLIKLDDRDSSTIKEYNSKGILLKFTDNKNCLVRTYNGSTGKIIKTEYKPYSTKVKYASNGDEITTSYDARGKVLKITKITAAQLRQMELDAIHAAQSNLNKQASELEAQQRKVVEMNEKLEKIKYDNNQKIQYVGDKRVHYVDGKIYSIGDERIRY